MNIFQRPRCYDPMTALVVGGAGVLGGTALSAKSKPDVTNDWLQNPEYANSQEARDTWWGKLQEWGNDPNYGAIAPDWNDIWQQTQQQVKSYFEGSAMAPGVNDAIKGSFAQRGMGGQAGETFALASSGATEAQQLANLQAQQNIAKNQFAETGRQNWLNSLNQFQAQKPGGEWQTQINPSSGQIWGNALSQVGGAIGSYGMSGIMSGIGSGWTSGIGGGYSGMGGGGAWQGVGSSGVMGGGSGISSPSNLGYTSYTGM